MAFDRNKFLAKFVVEARDHVSKLNEGFLHLEKNPDDSETLNALFRSAHTIKGSAKMIKLSVLSHVAHKLEDVMDALRQKRIPMSRELSDVFLEAIDAIDRMVNEIAAGNESAEVPEALCYKLEMMAKAENPEDHHAEAEHPKDIQALTPESIEDLKTPHVMIRESGEISKDQPSSSILHPSVVKPSETIRISSDKLDELIKLMGEIVSSHSRSKQRLQEVLEIERLSKRHNELIAYIEHSALPADRKEEILNHARLLHAQLRQLSLHIKEDVNIQSLLTADLQDRSLKLRMLPLSTIFEPFRRTVRELSRMAGKEIDLVFEGGETELDKKIIEKIGDPLMHLIRNSIDHGIESPADRKKAGKPETGIITLSARYEGGNVLIQISDDGAGISVSKIKEKAVKKKLYTEIEIQTISEAELINLIFLPGFSTVDMITDLSGRGVGMDVVKKNIVEDLKGSIHIETKEGKGSSFFIRLPLTMAIVHVLFIAASGITFAVPANYISEIISVSQKDIIGVVDRQAIRLRNEIIPTVRLDEVLKLPVKDRSRMVQEIDEYLILIASLGNEKMGIIIDALLDEEDMVIKSLPPHIQNIPFISGCIISGKNQIFNVLNIPRIVEAAKEAGGGDVRKVKTEEEKRDIHILIADDSVSTREIEKSILESYGYKVSVAGDGVEALDLAKSTPFDLIISDVEMPRMDGFALTERLRAEDAYKNTPVILITTRDREEDKKRGIMVGADAYIVKGSFEQDLLLETVQNLAG